jgi:hypothetical protein
MNKALTALLVIAFLAVTSYADERVGRYLIVMQNRENQYPQTIRIDTVTKKTWLLIHTPAPNGEVFLYWSEMIERPDALAIMKQWKEDAATH